MMRNAMTDIEEVPQTASTTPAAAREAKIVFVGKQHPLMAPPGIYFVDGNSAVLGLLHGEVTDAQVTATLNW